MSSKIFICLHCHQKYTKETKNEPCFFHPKEYLVSYLINKELGSLSGWQCCYALDRNAPGCKRADSHQ